jgi:threonine synthase
MLGEGTIKSDEKTVVVLTGTGLKVTNFYESALGLY